MVTKKPAAASAKPAAKKPAAKKPAAKKPAAKKPAARKPAARKPAARKPAAKKKSPQQPEVSVGMVQDTIAALRGEGDMVHGICPPAKKAVPVAASIVAAPRLPGGETIPESLRLWLAYDGEHLDLLDRSGQLRTTTQRAFIKEMLAEVAEELDDDDFDEAAMMEDILADEDAPDSPAVRLPDSASQAHFLVFDGSDEPPVIGYEKESFWHKYRSFGEFVQHWFGHKEPAWW